MADRQSLARALALLGQSRLSSNLNQLAHLANIGALPVDPQTESELYAALAGVRELRGLLMRALGLRPDTSLSSQALAYADASLASADEPERGE
jgi:hypothetical protein